LQANKQGKALLLLLIYDHFNSDDIVRFNTLLDEIRKADGVAVPADAIILGLNNPNKPEAYQGSDFASRFDLVEYNSIPAQALEQAIP